MLLRPLRYRRLWLALGALMLVGMLVVCLVPRVSEPTFAGIDKVEHLLAWLIVSSWFAALLERRALPMLAGGLIALGIGIEFAQEFMALGRQGDWRDVVANAVGVFGGISLAAWSRESWLARLEKWLPAT
ncbi:MAG: hypothetical protein R3E75_11550 [Steroidobacteraceae bacterium]|nr:VanZ family protein [Nevskiaceae bacterium]MCP5359705.1 VanZ family protein [Nevskiaceae bacterium]